MVLLDAEDRCSRQAELRWLQICRDSFLVSGSDGHTRLLPDRKSGSIGFIETGNMIELSGSLFYAFGGHGVCYYTPYGSSVPIM